MEPASTFMPSQTVAAAEAETLLLQRQVQETGQLRLRVVSLLEEVESLRAASQKQPGLGELIERLREANQHLVIAAVGAQDQLTRAEEANRRQEQFLSMLAHELRNPLAPLAMATELLGKLQDSHPQLPRLHGIFFRQVAHMTHLIDDLLDAARISSGKITLKKQALRLSDIIDNALETSRPLIERRYQRLHVDLPHDAIWIDGDLTRLAQVFANLLINAAKFSPEYEQISVTAERQGNAVQVLVRDRGIGIEPELQGTIFNLFTQGFQALDRSQGGLGIGLSLVRAIVELHGGSVSVNSAGLGLGSEFTVLLPLCAPPAAVNASAGVAGAKGPLCKVLLIEDNADTVYTLGELLRQEGHSVASAMDGASGLAMQREGNFDVIVCDIGLPGMSGLEVAQQLRRTAGSTPGQIHPCLIALTGYNHLELKSRAKDAGFDHYLMKPVAIDVLLDLILSCAHLSP